MAAAPADHAAIGVGLRVEEDNELSIAVRPE